MKTNYKTELGKSYMVLDCEKKEDSFALQMMEENHIENLLTLEKRCFNGEVQFFYDVTGMTPLADVAGKTPLREKECRRLLQGLYCVFEEVHSYFLEPQGLLLQAEYIYETPEKILFCYYPSNEVGKEGMTIEAFAEKLLDQIDNSDDDALELIYRFYALVKDAKKGILYILEEVLTEVDMSRMPEEESLLEELETDEIFVLEEKEEIAAEKPDVYTVGCFLLSLVAGICCFFLLKPEMRIASAILTVISFGGIIAGLTDIDIKRKK